MATDTLANTETNDGVYDGPEVEERIATGMRCEARGEPRVTKELRSKFSDVDVACALVGSGKRPY